jgi:hypothetical protein
VGRRCRRAWGRPRRRRDGDRHRASASPARTRRDCCRGDRCHRRAERADRAWHRASASPAQRRRDCCPDDRHPAWVRALPASERMLRAWARAHPAWALQRRRASPCVRRVPELRASGVQPGLRASQPLPEPASRPGRASTRPAWVRNRAWVRIRAWERHRAWGPSRAWARRPRAWARASTRTRRTWRHRMPCRSRRTSPSDGGRSELRSSRMRSGRTRPSPGVC